MVVQRELNSLPECLLVCNLVVMEWTATITGDLLGLFQDLSRRRKISSCYCAFAIKIIMLGERNEQVHRDIFIINALL